MPGVIPSEFSNPLRLPGSKGIRVIDVLLDIILPELASSAQEADGLVREEYREAVRLLGAGFFTDPEADFVRRLTKPPYNLLPRTPFPYGGELFDVTWAFLQATGARPEQWEIDEIPIEERVPDPSGLAGGTPLPVDPITGQIVFPINNFLPSLNRQPGIIFVPIGLFPVLGTIHLFGGQQIVGVSSGPNGSRILKYGDGPCIRTQNPTNLADDRHMTARRAADLRLSAGQVGRVDALLDAFSARFDLMDQLQEVPPNAPPSAWRDTPAEVRKEILAKTLVASEFPGVALPRGAKLCWLPVLLLLACNDAGERRVVDAGRDARVVEAGLDERVADAARDAGVDAQRADAARPDAALDAARDARPVDAVVDHGPPDACVGIVLPPPPESPDGSEVCNYRDDDGDGLVDEGFAYDFLGEPVRITPEPEPRPDDLRIARGPQGFGVSWTTAWGLRFLTLDAQGCPASPIIHVDQNPQGQPFLPESHDMAAAGDRYAAVFTQERRSLDGQWHGWGTFVQLFDANGHALGSPIDIDPSLSHLRFNAIVPFGEQFAVFSSAYHPVRGGLTYSAFVIIDRNGNITQGPSHPYDAPVGAGQAMASFIGMAYDGEGFGMAWVGTGLWFTRWDADGHVLTAPVGFGALAQRSGIGWTGQHYVTPSNNRYDVYLHYFSPQGEAAPWSPVSLGRDEQGLGSTGFVATMGEQIVVRAGTGGIFLKRYSFLGEALGPELSQRGRHARTLTHDALGLAVLVFLDVDAGAGVRHITFRRIGCP